MSSRSIGLSPELHAYLCRTAVRDTPLQRKLRKETAKMPMAGMQISPEQGQFLALLVELLGVTKALEVGTFTGYSSLAVAAALPRGGTLTCCDVSKEYTDIARRYWKAAGVSNRVRLRLGPAKKSLADLLAAGQAGTFDLAFIDADKENYDAYYEAALKLLKRGGVVAIDNVLWGGRVADKGKRDPSTSAIRRLNRKIGRDRRVNMALLPIGDGLTLARKR
jgi:caffeoyl-CoA O-methyltransferase